MSAIAEAAEVATSDLSDQVAKITKKAPFADVFLGSMTHDGRLSVESAQAIASHPSQRYRIASAIASGSLLTFNCNHLWASAVQMHQRTGTKWFAMLHSDIGPEPHWIDILIDEAERTGADILSAVVPIKNDEGVTSTAIADPADPWEPWARLTVRQINHESFPETFGIQQAVDALADLPEELRLAGAPAHRLLVNTGCMVVRMGEWCEGITWTIRDRIDRTTEEPRVLVIPEDWQFSIDAAEAGAKVFATKKLGLIHKGNGIYHNRAIYGKATNLTQKGAA